MMKSEFIELTGFEPTADEYRIIEEEYMVCDEDKQLFCKKWSKNGGIQRVSRQRVRKIEELEAAYATLDAQYDKKFIEDTERLRARNAEIEELKSLLLETRNQRDALDRQLMEANSKLRKLAEALAIIKEVA